MIIDLKDGKFIKVDIKKNEKGVYEYYSEGMLLGVYDPTKMKDEKFLEIDLELNHTISDEAKSQIRDEINGIVEQIKEKINSMDDKSIENEAEENRVLGEYLRELGADDRSFKRVGEIDLEKNKKTNELADTQNEDEKQKESNDKEKNNSSPISANKVNAKQEIDLGERATDMQNMKRWLEKSSGKTLPKGATKIIAIDSDELRKMKDENGKTIDNPSSQWGLAIIRKDENGKMIAEPLKKYLPKLEQSRSAGTNPRKAQQQITDKTDGRTEKSNPINAEYTIDGSRRNIIDIDQDHLNDMEIHIGKYGPHTNETTRTQVRGRNTTFATDTQARKAAMGNFKGVHSGENSKKELDQCDDSRKDYNDGDGDHVTKSDNHNHEIARKILNSNIDNNNDEKLSDFYNERDALQHFSNIAKNKPNLSEDQIIEIVAQELRDTAKTEHELGPQNK